MPAVTRIGHNCTAHRCFAASSRNASVNLKAVYRHAVAMASNRFNATVHIKDYDTFGFENPNLHNHLPTP